MTRMIKTPGIIFTIAAAHFVLCRLVVFLTMYFNLSNTGEGQTLTLLTRLLVGLTRTLYFPIISLSLYSRRLFPGNWIFVPIFVNSLLWGVCIYLGYILWKKNIARKSL